MIQTNSVIAPISVFPKQSSQRLKGHGNRFGSSQSGPRVPIIPYSFISQGSYQEKRDQKLKRLFTRIEKALDTGNILIVGDRTQYPQIIQSKILINKTLYTVSKWMLPWELKNPKGFEYGYLLEKVSADSGKTPDIQLYLGQSAQPNIQVECRYKQQHSLIRVMQDVPTDSPLILARAKHFFQRLEYRGLFEPDYDELILD